MKIEVYLITGNIFSYEVSCAEKAREHASKIWKEGFRVKIDNRHEWFGKHYIDKIVWDGEDDTTLAKKYGE